MGRSKEGRFHTLLSFFALLSAVLTKTNNQAIYTGTTDNEETLTYQTCYASWFQKFISYLNIYLNFD